MKPKTVARNEVESGFKESASMTQIHVFQYATLSKVKLKNDSTHFGVK